MSIKTVTTKTYHCIIECSEAEYDYSSEEMNNLFCSTLRSFEEQSCEPYPDLEWSEGALYGFSFDEIEQAQNMERFFSQYFIDLRKKL